MRVSELEGAALDMWVAKADGMEFTIRGGHPATSRRFDPEYHSNETDWKEFKSYFYFQPSLDWAQGGPIIQRERIIIKPYRDGGWGAAYEFDTDSRGGSFYMGRSQEGGTPLIAAMRAYVASKFGEEVPDEAIGAPQERANGEMG